VAKPYVDADSNSVDGQQLEVICDVQILRRSRLDMVGAVSTLPPVSLVYTCERPRQGPARPRPQPVHRLASKDLPPFEVIARWITLDATLSITLGVVLGAPRPLGRLPRVLRLLARHLRRPLSPRVPTFTSLVLSRLMGAALAP